VSALLKRATSPYIHPRLRREISAPKPRQKVYIPGRSPSSTRVERYDHAFAVVQLDVDFTAFVRGDGPSRFQRRPSAALQRPLRDLPGIELDNECVGSPHAPQRSGAITADDVPANSPRHLFPIHVYVVQRTPPVPPHLAKMLAPLGAISIENRGGKGRPATAPPAAGYCATPSTAYARKFRVLIPDGFQFLILLAGLPSVDLVETVPRYDNNA
jgi:hypothetical protein